MLAALALLVALASGDPSGGTQRGFKVSNWLNANKHALLESPRNC